MKTLKELFDVEYGTKLDLNKMKRLSPSQGGIAFVGRSGENSGVAATVAPLKGIPPFEGGLVTVALGGSKLLSAFVQESPFYTAQNVAVLRPLVTLSLAEKVFLCVCIRHNRSRYSAFGREANRTIRDLRVPDPSEFPAWVTTGEGGRGDIAVPLSSEPGHSLQIETWQPYRLGSLFIIKKGKRLIRREWKAGGTLFVGTSMKNNGIVGAISDEPMFPAGCVTVPYNGNGVAHAFYQPRPFCASDDIQVLLPPPGVDQAALLFVCTILRRERYRYSYGRKWHLARMQETIIRLPGQEGPDWQWMSDFMKRLPFSTGALGAL